MTRSRGGVLLDLFLIVLICALGIAGALAVWQGELLRKLLPSVGRFLPSLTAPAAAPASEPDIDVSDRAAGIQGRVRDLLTASGVDEKHVLGASTAERQEAGIRWLEGTLLVRRPRGFDDGKFLSALGPLLAERKLALMEDRREGTRRTMEIGDRKRVYQRLIFESR